MVNSISAIALYGFQDIPPNLEKKTIKLGINLLLIPRLDKKTDLGTYVRELVNNSSALFISKMDDELHTIVQFYFAANKKIFLISEEEDIPSLPKGVITIPDAGTAFKELFNETEKYVIASKIGNLELRFNSFGLTYLKAHKQGSETENISKQASKVQGQLESYFDGKRKIFNLKVCLKGTDFQRKVWNELMKIPFGQTISYGDIAHKVGDDNASRAVGLAISKNPIWIVIPCHRVLSKEGDLTGYAGGLVLKQSLLDMESNQTSLF
ncbi:MAG: methylated-DNA--[protein]-cysteine S-methyltransferase [Bacteroidales bacterium]|nr:methylated-DNA--[protein]-cysteine S-methyltransferase [Bacteroidales bacterium]